MSTCRRKGDELKEDDECWSSTKLLSAPGRSINKEEKEEDSRDQETYIKHLHQADIKELSR